ncbi:hypothetical protein MRX96_039230 [Rhipicephalus microplus]
MRRSETGRHEMPTSRLRKTSSPGPPWRNAAGAVRCPGRSLLTWARPRKPPLSAADVRPGEYFETPTRVATKRSFAATRPTSAIRTDRDALRLESMRTVTKTPSPYPCLE